MLVHILLTKIGFLSGFIYKYAGITFLWLHIWGVLKERFINIYYILNNILQ